MKIANPEIRSIVVKAYLSGSASRQQLADIFCYGRAHGGKRCLDSAPCGHWETVTIWSSIRLDGTTQSLVFEGAVDRKMFDAYIEEFLAPTLKPGDIVVMDNLKAHKSQKARDAIRMHQAEMLFLPTYKSRLQPCREDVEQNQTGGARYKTANRRGIDWCYSYSSGRHQRA